MDFLKFSQDQFKLTVTDDPVKCVIPYELLDGSQYMSFKIKGQVYYEPIFDPFMSWSYVNPHSKNVLVSQYPIKMAQHVTLKIDNFEILEELKFQLKNADVKDIEETHLPWKDFNNKGLLYFQNNVCFPKKLNKMVENYYGITKGNFL